jgi:hypothetical protein
MGPSSPLSCKSRLARAAVGVAAVAVGALAAVGLDAARRPSDAFTTELEASSLATARFFRAVRTLNGGHAAAAQALLEPIDRALATLPPEAPWIAPTTDFESFGELRGKVRATLGRTLLEQRRSDEGFRRIDEALALWPEDTWLYLFLTEQPEYASTPEKLADLFDKAQKTACQNFPLCRDHVTLAARRGWNALVQGRPDEAEAVFRDGLRYEPGNAFFRLGLAGVRLRRGDCAGGKAELERAHVEMGRDQGLVPILRQAVAACEAAPAGPP